MQVNRTTEAIRFDTGISMAEYAEGAVGHSRTQNEQSLLPGATTVSEALASIFPDGHGVSGEIMSALVAGNPAMLRTASGFNQSAREQLQKKQEQLMAPIITAVRNAISEVGNEGKYTFILDQQVTSFRASNAPDVTAQVRKKLNIPANAKPVNVPQ